MDFRGRSVADRLRCRSGFVRSGRVLRESGGAHHRCAGLRKAGTSFACAIVEGGAVKCWGANLSGQLGLGDTAARGDGPNEMGDALGFVSLGAGRTAKVVSTGSSHACAVLDNGELKCWGSNAQGKLGLGDANARGDAPGEMGNNLPAVNLGTGRTAKAVAAGENHTCAILDTDEVKCWGDNYYSQLGLGDRVARGAQPTDMGDNLPTVSLGTGRTVKAVTTRLRTTCVVLDNDQVKCWGYNSRGALGLGLQGDRGWSPSHMGDNLPVVSLGSGRTARSVAAGELNMCALLDNGQVKCWGSATFGVPGQGDTNHRGDAADEMGDNLAPVALGAGRSAKALAMGSRHACAILDTDQLKCWGDNSAGQLGIGDTAARGDNPGELGDFLPAVFVGTGRTVRAVDGGYAFTCAVLDNGQVKCWGSSPYGQLGLGDTNTRGDTAGEMGDSLPAVQLGSASAKHLDAGAGQACAVLHNGQVKCWGRNNYGQLGLGDVAHRGDAAGEMGTSLPAVTLGTGRTAKSIAAGDGSSCALLDNNQVKCWGLNNAGQLGLGDIANRGDAAGEMGNSLPVVALGTSRTAQSVDIGGWFACARLDTNQVKCWGYNEWGRLGLGDVVNRGDGPGEMGDNLPAVALGTGRTAQQVSTGYGHACALLDTNQIKCWGVNTFGSLGIGSVTHRGDEPSEMGDNLPIVALGSGRSAKAVSAGSHHTCALLDNAQVKCWGRNSEGQLGLGDVNHRGDAAGEMGDSLPTLPLGIGRSARSVTAGDLMTCVVLDTWQVKCWGYNVRGQLGQGSTATLGDGPGEMGDNLAAIALGTGRSANAVAIGDANVCVRLDTNQVKCWGYNPDGRLGLGDLATRGDNPGEMGDSLPIANLGLELGAF